jgi:hypothetical protein
MKNFLFLAVVGSILFIAGASSAVRCDMWETGTDINEVVSVARKHDISIAKEGYV